VRRKRRTRYQWLLNTGTIGPSADIDDTTQGRELALNIPTNGTTDIAIVDLLNDTPSEDVIFGGNVLPTMAQTIGNEYAIRRIVGKCHVSRNTLGTTSPGVLIAAGIFVARAGDFGDFAGAENLPINSGTAAAQIDNYSPLRLENVREPWIWRRTWILGTSTITDAGLEGAQSYPINNAAYGSIQDGAHIDAKTGRRIRDGERLWAVLAGRNFPLNSTSATTATLVRAYMDYRVLGAMRRAHNRSAF